ncbi:NAD(P)-dependent oxidoreductase [Niveispirillum lacus]|uniref:NAD(P)-dependent oxidoreductase n=1 Tax=Niveispirillum lacus TaxID=1981099 RepID=UPI0013FD8DE5|nr:NAD(P)-dependent oxidoreductase [Niveispirillum lacus]
MAAGVRNFRPCCLSPLGIKVAAARATEVTARGASREQGPCRSSAVWQRVPGSPAIRREAAPMNIVMFETEAWQEAFCQRLVPHQQIRCVTAPLSAANADMFADAEVISTFIDSKLDAPTLLSLRKLQLIATRSTGYDHIDLDACRAAGVTVCNVPNYGDPTVAEYTFALLLALFRKVPAAVERTRRGDFSQSGLRGSDLAGKTMGVIGAGRIGQRVIRIARAFGMSVLAFDARPDKGLEVQLGMRFVTLNQVLKRSDVVSLHVPGGAGTHELISAQKLALMKPEAVLINTARGDVVDTEALIRALAEQRIAGAALDVFSQESWLRDEAEIFRPNADPTISGLRMLAADRALLCIPNVIASAHIAYDTHEAVSRILDITLANISAFAAGRPENLVGEPIIRPSTALVAFKVSHASTPDLSVGFETAIAPLIDDVRRHTAAFLNTPDAPCVHALRGALRRTRACILMFRTLLPAKDCRWVRRELGRFSRQLGPVRDLDVLIGRHSADVLAGPARIDKTTLDETVWYARAVAAAVAQRHARTARVTIMVEGLSDWLQAQTCAATGDALSTHMTEWLLSADARARKVGNLNISRGTNTRHRLRRHLRTLRDNAEVFLRLHNPRIGGAYVAALDDLHTLLGDINDNAVVVRLERKLKSPMPTVGLTHLHRTRSDRLKAAWVRFETLAAPWAAPDTARAG